MNRRIILSIICLSLLATQAMAAKTPTTAKPAAAAKPATPDKTPAAAKEKTLGTFGVWQAYAYDQGGQTVCYMVTNKILKSTGPAKRTPPYLMITHRPVEGSTDVFSYGAGTPLNTRRNVEVTVGKEHFDLFAVKDIAWARDAQTDHKMAAVLRTDTQAQTKATPSAKGAKTVADIFELNGAIGAYKAIGKACGLPEEKAPKSAHPKVPIKKSASSKAKKPT